MGHLPSSPIRSVSAAEWITAWTDPCLFPPPPFIFLALTFIEAFQRNTPQAIHFLKWSYSEKACGVGVRMCGIYKWAKQSFIFPQIFFFYLFESLYSSVFSRFFSLFLSPSLHTSSPCPPPSQGCCSPFWMSTPTWCVRTVARLDVKKASTDSSKRGSPPAPRPTMRSPAGTPRRCFRCRTLFEQERAAAQPASIITTHRGSRLKKKSPQCAVNTYSL